MENPSKKRASQRGDERKRKSKTRVGEGSPALPKSQQTSPTPQTSCSSGTSSSTAAVTAQSAAAGTLGDGGFVIKGVSKQLDGKQVPGWAKYILVEYDSDRNMLPTSPAFFKTLKE